MLYYRIIPQFDGKTIKDRSLISNELYTISEMKRFNIPVNYAREVEISKKQVYTFFGARFQSGTDCNSKL